MTDTISQAEILASLAEPRSKICRFFAALFEGPRTEALLSALPSVLEAVNAEAELFDIEERAEASPLSAGTALEQEIAKLFYGVGLRTVAMSESAYTSEERLNCQEPARRLTQIYRASGLALSGPKEALADSLPVQMAFAARMIEEGKSAAEQRELIDAHLVPLGLTVADAIASHPQCVLLRGAAKILRVFMLSERVLLLTESIEER